MVPGVRKPYEKPAIVLEKELETLAGDCGPGDNNIYLGGNNCKGPDTGACILLFS
jgi:hypothetical protein